VRVGILSGQVFFPFGITLGMSHFSLAQQLGMEVCGRDSLNWRRRRCLRPYGGIFVLQACWRTCF